MVCTVRLAVAGWVMSVPLLLAAVSVPASAAVPPPPAALTNAVRAPDSHRGDVAFIESGDLYLLSHSTAVVRRLTWGAGRNDPAFSPSGGQIAYDRAGDIWVLTIGAGSRQVTHSGGASQPAWSPDGRTLAYTQVVGAGHSEIFQIPVAAGAAVRLTWTASSGCSGSQPIWQGSGGWVDYVRTNPGGGSCTPGIVRRSASSTGQLIVPDRYASDPVVTTDGRHLVYVAPCDPSVCLSYGVWSATLTGGGRHSTAALGGWSCGEGDLCVQAVSSSPFGGWTQEGTWSDPDTGQVMTCFQGAVENPDHSVTATAPSACVHELVGAFTVRPN